MRIAIFNNGNDNDNDNDNNNNDNDNDRNKEADSIGGTISGYIFEVKNCYACI